MTDADRQAIDRWFAGLLEDAADRSAALDRVHAALVDTGSLSRVTMHRYMCRRGCQLAVVFGVAGLVLCAVRDHKLSPGRNRAVSTASARAERTLDDDRHWPGHVHDVADLARWDGQAGIPVTCRHRQAVLLPDDVLGAVAGVTPGHPNRPTIL